MEPIMLYNQSRLRCHSIAQELKPVEEIHPGGKLSIAILLPASSSVDTTAFVPAGRPKEPFARRELDVLRRERAG